MNSIELLYCSRFSEFSYSSYWHLPILFLFLLSFHLSYAFLYIHCFAPICILTYVQHYAKGIYCCIQISCQDPTLLGVFKHMDINDIFPSLALIPELIFLHFSALNCFVYSCSESIQVIPNLIALLLYIDCSYHGLSRQFNLLSFDL